MFPLDDLVSAKVVNPLIRTPQYLHPNVKETHKSTVSHMAAQPSMAQELDSYMTLSHPV